MLNSPHEKTISSNISREAFKEIEPLLLSGRKQTRPRVVDVYEVFCALLYILKSGCQWSMLPRDFPPKSTVHYYFSIWNKKSSETEPSILEQALKKCGWRGPYQQWTERTNELYHH